ncbi:hypothetical protein T4B_10571, partial [Trichinella pseudospiralis]
LKHHILRQVKYTLADNLAKSDWYDPGVEKKETSQWTTFLPAYNWLKICWLTEQL